MVVVVILVVDVVVLSLILAVRRLLVAWEDLLGAVVPSLDVEVAVAAVVVAGVESILARVVVVGIVVVHDKFSGKLKQK